MITTTRMQPVLCPWCGHMLSAATGIEHDKRPNAGDFSVCIGCGGPMRFNHDGSLRKFTDEDVAELTADPKCSSKMVRTILAVIAAHKKGL